MVLIERIEGRKAKLDATVPGDYEKEVYLDALLIVAQGLVTLGERYAAEADRLAKNESDPRRKKELEDIAAICRHVPAKPARTFREAVQSFYFYQIAIFMEQNAAAYNPGRMDQYLYPFYKKDLDEGRITADEAQEIFGCLWVKFSEPCLFQDEKSAEYSVRIAMWLAVGLLVLAEVISRCVPPLIAALAAVPLAGSSTLETTTVVHAVSGLIAAVPAAGSIVCYSVAAGRLAGTGRLAGPVRDFFHSSRPPKPGIDGGTPGRPTTGPAEGIDS